jgi:nitroreductase
MALVLPSSLASAFREDAAMKTTETLSALDVIYSRRSVRAYTTERVPQSTVRALLDAAVQAPSSLGGDSLAFVVVQHPRRLARLSELTKTRWTELVHTDMELHLAASLSPGIDLARGADPEFDVFYGATTLIVICARRPDSFAAADCWLAAENLMLAAEALGLATCCIGAASAALNTAEMRLDLAIPPVFIAVAPIVVGIPAAPSRPLERRVPDVIAWK